MPWEPTPKYQGNSLLAKVGNFLSRIILDPISRAAHNSMMRDIARNSQKKAERLHARQQDPRQTDPLLVRVAQNGSILDVRGSFEIDDDIQDLLNQALSGEYLSARQRQSLAEYNVQLVFKSYEVMMFCHPEQPGLQPVWFGLRHKLYPTTIYPYLPTDIETQTENLDELHDTMRITNRTIDDLARCHDHLVKFEKEALRKQEDDRASERASLATIIWHHDDLPRLQREREARAQQAENDKYRKR